MSHHVHDEAEFAKLLENANAAGNATVIKFTAVWCAPCKVIAPKFEELAKKYKKYCLFLTVDVDELQEVSTTFKIRSIPAFVAIHQMTVKETWLGANPVILEQKIEKYASLNRPKAASSLAAREAL